MVVYHNPLFLAATALARTTAPVRRPPARRWFPTRWFGLVGGCPLRASRRDTSPSSWFGGRARAHCGWPRARCWGNPSGMASVRTMSAMSVSPMSPITMRRRRGWRAVMRVVRSAVARMVTVIDCHCGIARNRRCIVGGRRVVDRCRIVDWFDGGYIAHIGWRHATCEQAAQAQQQECLTCEVHDPPRFLFHGVRKLYHHFLTFAKNFHNTCCRVSKKGNHRDCPPDPLEIMGTVPLNPWGLSPRSPRVSSGTVPTKPGDCPP